MGLAGHELPRLYPGIPWWTHRWWPSGLSIVSLVTLPFPERENLQGMRAVLPFWKESSASSKDGLAVLEIFHIIRKWDKNLHTVVSRTCDPATVAHRHHQEAKMD